MSSSSPVVSVAITAYNSSKWLAHAIGSALSQQTTFPFEIVIGDDCSTDGTVAIARAWQQKHPDQIHVLERPRNVGMQRNFYDTFEQCRGKYIAWLDADDVWTDRDKLSIQVQVLEADPSVSVCCHYVRWVAPDREVRRARYPNLAPGRYGLDQILRHDFVPSPSILFRNGIHRSLPASFFELTAIADWPLLALAATTGDIVLLDRTMADYLMAPASSMTSKGDQYWFAMDIEFYDFVQQIVPPRWRRLAKAEQGKRYEALAYLLRTRGEFPAARAAALNAFRAPTLADNAVTKTRTLASVFLRGLAFSFHRHAAQPGSMGSHRKA